MEVEGLLNMKRVGRCGAVLALAVLLPDGAAQAEAYKCRGADGRVEIANAPCPGGASTLKTLPDEPVSEADRRRAEREVERMRGYVEQREAAQRADDAAERERQRLQQPAAAAPGNGRSTEDCLRDLDRQALSPPLRQQMEAACRGYPSSQPVYVPVPVAVPVRPMHPRPPPRNEPDREPPKTISKPGVACSPKDKYCVR